ncbi:hypothetical protein SPRG_12917 [Saprolegnia parasitica CBS 223.65]|uniref:glutathione-specific gamma-glutamylcyclotransferase n=1 Tax=Saprolegnia parasitica (strain CBS 223.65) TaxID=695850 RepID=A0A067C3L1_SAPPC|nr:hypothetical protein SPRG_12917 [Saprolegnia parasitica CBS 223.65]KDO21136.1 hypothetical protein SPRG_12917 [Saprolegnia parasitica CBS 223.65]|eukprot:XP_012208136.1 hypothetical protein SPRG_12917 [Saprolegnia parasitica CBS 223.65]
MWIFGYGSIVWKTDFPVEDTMFGYVDGWHRRFWQGSPDHRGVPGALGRVVTLIKDADMAPFASLDRHASRCAPTWGRIYKVPADEVPEILAQLDHREKAGYDRAEVDVHCTDGVVRSALVFIATPDNSDFLGPAPLDIMAHEIRTRVGPSGPNLEYFEKLCQCMRDIHVEDPHLLDLEAAIAQQAKAT